MGLEPGERTWARIASLISKDEFLRCSFKHHIFQYKIDDTLWILVLTMVSVSVCLSLHFCACLSMQALPTKKTKHAGAYLCLCSLFVSIFTNGGRVGQYSQRRMVHLRH